MGKSFDPKELRRSFGQFATGVVVVTTCDEQGEAVGLTVNSFSSVSVDPPLVLFSLAKSSFNWRNFVRAKSFVVNVLGQNQEIISNQFSKAHSAKWQGVDYQIGDFGAPVISGALAHFECSPFSQCDGGDHTIFVGRVENHVVSRDEAPLIFFRGHYHRIETGDVSVGK